MYNFIIVHDYLANKDYYYYVVYVIYVYRFFVEVIKFYSIQTVPKRKTITDSKTEFNVGQ